MKTFLILVLAFAIVTLLGLSVTTGMYGVRAQDSPVPTPTPVVVEPPPDVPPDPVPIPPTLLELIVKLLTEGAAWLSAIIVGLFSIWQKYSVSFVRKRFPNAKGDATRINGGIAQLFAGLTAIVLALITWSLTYLTGFVGSFDIAGLLTLAGSIFIGGYGIHKVDKLSSIAKAFKLIAEMSK